MYPPVESLAEGLLSCIFKDHGVLSETCLNPSMVPGVYGLILQAMKRLEGQGVAPDVETLYMLPELSQCKAEVVRLSDNAFTSENWEYYQKGLIEAWSIKKLSTLGKMISEGKGTASEITNLVEKTLLEVGNVVSKSDIVPIESLFGDWTNRLEERIKAKGKIPGISWGFSTIDSCTLGACKNQLVVIGARPSEGKSAIAVQMLRYQAYSEGVNVGLITIESGGLEVVSRFMSGGIPIDGMKVSLGIVAPSQFVDIKTFIERSQDKHDRVFIYDRPGITMAELRSAARRMVLNYGVKVLYVDYLQLIHVPNAENKIAEVGAASVALKELARELGICVVVLAQLKRDEKNARPTMGSIQWASAVEQTADAIWLLYHKRDENGVIIESRIILEKVRDGRTEDVFVRFDKPIVSFFEIEKGNAK
jgi:replicative DNA helicase